MLQFYADCRGGNFRPQEAKNISAALRIGDEVTILPEPENPHDQNAMKVMVGDAHIGYVARETAANLAHWMDQGYQVAARVSGRTNTLTPQLQIALFEEDEEWEWEEQDPMETMDSWEG